jgi:chromate reductase
MSASPGMLGGVKAQFHLRQTFVFLDIRALNRPEVVVTFAAEKIDDNGRVTDEKTREKIRELLAALAAWTLKLKGG